MRREYVPRRITKFRIDKHISAKSMSEKLGMSENYINQIENAKALPSMEMFFKICDYFQITPGEFFDDQNTCPEKLHKLVEAAKALSDKDLETLVGIAERFGNKK